MTTSRSPWGTAGGARRLWGSPVVRRWVGGPAVKAKVSGRTGDGRPTGRSLDTHRGQRGPCSSMMSDPDRWVSADPRPWPALLKEFTPKRSLVRTQYRPPVRKALWPAKTLTSEGLSRCRSGLSGQLLDANARHRDYLSRHLHQHPCIVRHANILDLGLSNSRRPMTSGNAVEEHDNGRLTSSSPTVNRPAAAHRANGDDADSCGQMSLDFLLRVPVRTHQSVLRLSSGRGHHRWSVPAAGRIGRLRTRHVTVTGIPSPASSRTSG